MANARPLKRSFNVTQLGLNVDSATTGAWTVPLSAAGVVAGTVSFHKAAAATTSVLHIPIPFSAWGPPMANEDARPSVIEMFYLVTTADFTSAPTVVLNKLTFPGGTGTGLGALAAVTQTLTFAGIDTIGKVAGAGAAGSHIAVVTITNPAYLTDQESLIATFTMNEAATSVIDILGITVTYASNF